MTTTIFDFTFFWTNSFNYKRNHSKRNKVNKNKVPDLSRSKNHNTGILENQYFFIFFKTILLLSITFRTKQLLEYYILYIRVFYFIFFLWYLRDFSTMFLQFWWIIYWWKIKKRIRHLWYIQKFDKMNIIVNKW